LKDEIKQYVMQEISNMLRQKEEKPQAFTLTASLLNFYILYFE
jgi:hypothetical protein